jgi:hypothetical protein
MGTRLHIVVDQREREAFRARARAEGITLSEWLRLAGRERLARQAPARLATEADLVAFFADCDRRERGVEPDWEDHLAVMARSRARAVEPG